MITLKYSLKAYCSTSSSFWSISNAPNSTCISGGNKCSFFEKLGTLCFLETSVLRFTFLPYYQQNPCRRNYERKNTDLNCFMPYYRRFHPRDFFKDAKSYTITGNGMLQCCYNSVAVYHPNKYILPINHPAKKKTLLDGILHQKLLVRRKRCVKNCIHTI